MDSASSCAVPVKPAMPTARGQEPHRPVGLGFAFPSSLCPPESGMGRCVPSLPSPSAARVPLWRPLTLVTGWSWSGTRHLHGSTCRSHQDCLSWPTERVGVWGAVQQSERGWRPCLPLPRTVRRSGPHRIFQSPSPVPEQWAQLLRTRHDSQLFSCLNSPDPPRIRQGGLWGLGRSCGSGGLEPGWDMAAGFHFVP